jgi:hypothetical protein
MKILFLFSSAVHDDMMADQLFGAFRRLYNAYDYPKRLPMYNIGSSLPYWGMGSFSKNLLKEDNQDRTQPPNPDDYDLIILECGAIYDQYFPFWSDKQEFIKKCQGKPTICLITNDPFTDEPLPSTVLKGKNVLMAIREPEVRKLPKDINVFPMTFMVPESWCKYEPIKEKHVFASMSPTNELRKELLAKYGQAIWTTNLKTYLDTIREYKYGVSVQGAGWLCQRDAELGGNTLLCLQESPINFPEWYIDGVDCIKFKTVNELEEKIKKYDWETLYKACFKKTINNFTSDATAKRLYHSIPH